jgi:K+-transporting ATPase c subunit
MRPARSRRSTARAVATITILALLVAAFLYDRLRNTTPTVPNETVEGLKLLSREFSAPGYFHLNPSVTNRPAHDSHLDYYIEADIARQQINRVLKERNLEIDQAGDLEQLIDRIAEPSKSRAVGSTTVNVLRLNLALDEALKRE